MAEVPQSLKSVGTTQVTSTAGLVLLDTRRRIVYQNPEALRILTFPEPVNTNFVVSLPCVLRSLIDQGRSPGPAGEFKSGRRRYLTRSFALACGAERTDQACAGILMERAGPKFVDISVAAQQFGLTQREQQTVELLTLGLTSKEIADRMNISPNTVKAFFRLVMTKMAVNTRSGIVGKIARMQSAVL